MTSSVAGDILPLSGQSIEGMVAKHERNRGNENIGEAVNCVFDLMGRTQTV